MGERYDTLASTGTRIDSRTRQPPTGAGAGAVIGFAIDVTLAVVGSTFGTYPARRAARLSPVDAIARE